MRLTARCARGGTCVRGGGLAGGARDQNGRPTASVGAKNVTLTRGSLRRACSPAQYSAWRSVDSSGCIMMALRVGRGHLAFAQCEGDVAACTVRVQTVDLLMWTSVWGPGRLRSDGGLATDELDAAPCGAGWIELNVCMSATGHVKHAWAHMGSVHYHSDAATAGSGRLWVGGAGGEPGVLLLRT